eukprot:1905840-Rhodomonas_salina.4
MSRVPRQAWHAPADSIRSHRESVNVTHLLRLPAHGEADSSGATETLHSNLLPVKCDLHSFKPDMHRLCAAAVPVLPQGRAEDVFRAKPAPEPGTGRTAS